MKTPDGKTITFTFVSAQLKDPEKRWAVNVTFPPGAGPDALLAVAAEDGLGRPVAEGVFEFAGRLVKITGGTGSLAYADFVRGKHETGLWLRRPGLDPVPGALTFA